MKNYPRVVPSEHLIRRYLKSITFGKYLQCPRCNSRRIKKYGKRYHCKKCRKFFSLTSHTWLKGLKLPLQTFWLILWCWLEKVPIDQARKLCGVNIRTIRSWYSKFRENIPLDYRVRLKGTIQCDEFYRGGFSIIGIKQIGTRKIVCKFFKKNSVDRRDVIEVFKEHVVPGSKLYTDGASIYKTIDKWWPVKHKYELHKKFEFKITSEIEGLWGNFVTFIRRMYHHVTLSKLPEYLSEFVARFSHPEIFDSPLTFLQNSIIPVSY